VVEGLEGGDRFAIVSKVHHCMVDGMSSVDLLAVLLTIEPTDHADPPVRWVPRPMPTWWQMLRAEATRRARTPLEAVSDFRQVLVDIRDPRSDIRTMWRAARGMLRSSLRTVSDTPLNKPIGPHRRFDWLVMDLADVKNVRKRLGGSLNDVVLTTVAGAVATLPRGPAGVRRLSRLPGDGAGERPLGGGEGHPRQSRVGVDHRSALAERDPKKRLLKISETTARLKETKQALGAEMLSRVAEWTPSTAALAREQHDDPGPALQSGRDQRTWSASAALSAGARMLDNSARSRSPTTSGSASSSSATPESSAGASTPTGIWSGSARLRGGGRGRVSRAATAGGSAADRHAERGGQPEARAHHRARARLTSPAPAPQTACAFTRAGADPRGAGSHESADAAQM